MLDALKALFQNPDANIPLPEAAGREAVAAILVASARADGVYDPGEADAIKRILAKRYGLSDQGAADLRSVGEEAEADAMDLVRFTRAIKRVIPHEDRIAVIEDIWEVALSDGARSDEENALVRKLCGLLYVEDKDAGMARQRVINRL